MDLKWREERKKRSLKVNLYGTRLAQIVGAVMLWLSIPTAMPFVSHAQPTPMRLTLEEKADRQTGYRLQRVKKNGHLWKYVPYRLPVERSAREQQIYFDIMKQRIREKHVMSLHTLTPTETSALRRFDTQIKLLLSLVLCEKHSFLDSTCGERRVKELLSLRVK
jgi:hypothetical protein